MSAPVLAVDDLHVRVRDVDVLRGVSLAVHPGEAVGIVGETGSGKTMTVRAVTGLLPSIGARVTHGTITLDGESVATASQKAWRRWQGRTLALVPQASMSSLSPLRRVGGQLAETIHRAGHGADLDAEIAALLESVHLAPTKDLLRSYPHELSGGMRQRVMIALALAVRPRLLIADEPTTALDAAVRTSILDLFGELRRERGLALVIVSHDIATIARSTDRTVVMYAGRSVESGTTSRVIGGPAHPYTEALLAALPERTPPGRRLPVVPGQPPSPGDVGAGCSFAPRCPRAVASCAAEPPAFAPVGDGRLVACLLGSERSVR